MQRSFNTTSSTKYRTQCSGESTKTKFSVNGKLNAMLDKRKMGHYSQITAQQMKKQSKVSLENEADWQKRTPKLHKKMVTEKPTMALSSVAQTLKFLYFFGSC